MRKMLPLLLLVVAAAPGVAEDKKAEKTIVETAAGKKDFSTLVAAVKAADLVDTLNGDGPFTVFAPTNEAFEKLGKDKVEAVLKDKEKLTAILKAHVVSGKVLAEDAVKLDGKDVETLNGKFPLKVSGKTVTLGEAKITKTDIVCKNGVIHVIDTVLMPAEKK